MDVIKISLEALLQRATNPQNENIDTAAVEAFCALINKEKEGPLMGIRLLATRMHSKNEQEALQTLHILDYCMQKCGVLFQDEIGKFRFLNEMIKLVSPKYLGCHTPLSVKQKVLQLMYLWMLDYPKQSKIKDAYDMLKKQGVIKDVPLSVSADYTLERQHQTIFQDEEKGKLLKKLLQSKNPEDLQAANRLIKTMVKEDEKKAELKSRRISELESVQNNIRLLNEMLDSYKSGVSSQDETELIKELHESCLRMRPNIAKLASETQQNDEILSEILRVNDELGHVFDKYQLVMILREEIRKDAHLQSLSLLDLTSGQASRECKQQICFAKSNVDMLCDILTNPNSIDALGGLGISDGTSILKPTVSAMEQKTKTSKDITNGDLTDKLTKQKGFEDLDGLGESLLMENLQMATSRIGAGTHQFNKSQQDKIPMNLLQSKTNTIFSQVTSNQTPTSHLTNPIKSRINDDITKQTLKDLNIDLDHLLLSASIDKEQANSNLINEYQQLPPNSNANDGNGDDLLVDITTTPTPTPTMTPTLSRTISSSSSIASSAASSTTATSSTAIGNSNNEKKDVDDKCVENGGGGTIDGNTTSLHKNKVKLSDLFVDLKSIKPGNIQPIIALDETHDGITLTLYFGKEKPHEDVSVVVVSIVSKNELPMKNVLFRAIVPKSCKLKLQPASASDLPPYNPFLPAAAITQVMLIANPDKIKLSLKFIVSYNVDDETMTEMGEIEELPT